MTKGFIFSIDSILAVIILALFLLAAAFLSSRYEDPYPMLLMQKQANDLLIVFDKTGELSTLNSSLITISLDNTIHSSAAWNLEIDYYNYSRGFAHAGNMSMGSPYTAEKKIVIAQREFLVFENNSLKNYGIARLRLWPK